MFFFYRNLSEDLTTDKIAEIRAKLISNRRTRIKPEDEDSKTTSLALSDLEVSCGKKKQNPPILSLINI